MKNAENIDFTVDIVYTVYREVIKILEEKNFTKRKDNPHGKDLYWQDKGRLQP